MVSVLSKDRKQVRAQTEGIGFKISAKREVLELRSYGQTLKSIWDNIQENGIQYLGG
jgi:hypothetical protein